MNFKPAVKVFLLISLHIETAFNSLAQDTAFYPDKTIKNISFWTKEERTTHYILFNDTKGNNFLKPGELLYHYYDSLISAERFYNIRDSILTERYFVTSNTTGMDTIYEITGNEDEIMSNMDTLGEFIYRNKTYPEAALKYRIQGEVEINFTINKKGEIINIKPETHLGYGLEDEIMKQIQKFHYLEAIIYNDKPVNYNTTIGMKFSLPPQKNK